VNKNPNTIIVGNGNISIQFQDPIKKNIVFNEFIVVLLERNVESTDVQNINCLNKKDGAQIWVINRLEEIEYNGEKYKGIDSPYVDIVKVSENVVRVFNWDGTKFDIDIRNGNLLTNPIESRKGNRPW